MQFIKKHKSVRIKALIFFAIFVFLILYLYIDFIKESVNILVISLVISRILYPIKKYLNNKKVFNNKINSLIITLLLVILCVLIGAIIIPKVFNEMNNSKEIINKLREYKDSFENSTRYKNGLIVKYIYDALKIKLKTSSVKIVGSIITVFSKIIDNMLSYAVVPVIIYYLLSDYEKIIKKIYNKIPEDKQEAFYKTVKDCNKSLGKYLIGQLILCFIITILTFIILLFFKIKFSILLSLCNGIFNIIPYFGPILGGIPIVIIAFIESKSKGLWILFLLFVIQQIEGNILSPKVTGESTNIHPLIIIILLLIGDKAYGIFGMIFAIPIAVIIKVIYEDIKFYT